MNSTEITTTTKMKTNEYVAAALVAFLSYGVEKAISKYSKNKTWNTLGAVFGSTAAVEYLRSNKMMPIVGDVNLNRGTIL